MSVKIPLEFEFAPADASRFVPMHLGNAHCAVAELYPGDSLPLPPTRAAIMSPQSRDLVNRGADCNCLDISDSTENSKVHALRVLALARMVKPPSNESRVSCVA
jgi:hypothetical protein